MYNLFKYKTNEIFRYGTWFAQTSQLNTAGKHVSLATWAYVSVHPSVEKEQSLKVQNNLDKIWFAWVLCWFFEGNGGGWFGWLLGVGFSSPLFFFLSYLDHF